MAGRQKGSFQLVKQSLIALAVRSELIKPSLIFHLEHEWQTGPDITALDDDPFESHPRQFTRPDLFLQLSVKITRVEQRSMINAAKNFNKIRW